MAAMLSAPVTCSSKIGASPRAFAGLPGTPVDSQTDLSRQPERSGLFSSASLQNSAAKLGVLTCSCPEIWTRLPCAEANSCQVSYLHSFITLVYCVLTSSSCFLSVLTSHLKAAFISAAHRRSRLHELRWLQPSSVPPQQQCLQAPLQQRQP